MPPEISVVIPTYNRASLIGHTLQAVRQQRLPPAEIIVVDDGSTDNTAEIVARLDEPRIRYHAIANSGDLVARNTGVRMARAPIVAFCDSDDLWRPNFLHRVATLLERRPSVRAVYANFCIVRDGEWERGTKFDDAPAGYWDGVDQIEDWAAVFEGSFVDRLVRFQPFFPSAMAVDRERFMEAGGWDEAVTRIVGCDFATILRVAERGHLGILFEPLVGIRKHGQNISGNVEKMNLGDARVLEYVLAARPSLQKHAGQIRRSINQRRRDALGLAFARRDFAQVRQIARLVTPHNWSALAKIAIAYAVKPVERALLRNG